MKRFCHGVLLVTSPFVNVKSQVGVVTRGRVMPRDLQRLLKAHQTDHVHMSKVEKCEIGAKFSSEF